MPPARKPYPFAFAVWDTLDGRIYGRVVQDLKVAQRLVDKNNAVNEVKDRYCLFEIDEFDFEKFVGKTFDEYFFPERYKPVYTWK